MTTNLEGMEESSISQRHSTMSCILVQYLHYTNSPNAEQELLLDYRTYTSTDANYRYMRALLDSQDKQNKCGASRAWYSLYI